MTKLPRPSGQEFVRFLERPGIRRHTDSRQPPTFSKEAHGGHASRFMENQPLKIGTLRSILRDIELSPAEFAEAWRG